MPGNIKRFILLFGFLSAIMFVSIQADADATSYFKLRVSPESLSFQVTRGSSADQAVKVVNEGDTEMTINMGVYDLDGAQEASKWLSVEPSTFSLAPGESRYVYVTINVPYDAEFGKHIVVVRANPLPITPPDRRWLNISPGSTSGTILNITVPGVIKEDLVLEDFRVDLKTKYPKFYLKVRNKGNVHVDLNGAIEITEQLSKKQYTLPMSAMLIPADSSRDIELEWKTAPLFGTYQAKLNAMYGDSNTRLKSIIEFSTLPTGSIYTYMLIGAVIVVLIAIILYRRNKKHDSKMRMMSSSIVMFISLLVSCTLLYNYVHIANAQTTGGEFSIESSVRGTTVVFRGKTMPNGLVTIGEGAQSIGSVVADSEGEFSYIYPYAGFGSHTYSLKAEDDNNVETRTISYDLEVESTTTVYVEDILLPPTISLSESNISGGEDVTIYGMAAPNTAISVFVSSIEASYGTASNLAGNWSLVVSADYPAGSYKIFALTTDSQGKVSESSKEVQLKVGSNGPLNQADTKCCDKRSDLNCDGKVSLPDFSILMYYWKKDNHCADANDDGIVNLADFSIMMFDWTS